MSRAVTQPVCLTAMVVSTISVCEGLGDASWGVGEARSIGEGGDSITLPKRRSLACMRGCFEFMRPGVLEAAVSLLGWLSFPTSSIPNLVPRYHVSVDWIKRERRRR